MGENKVPYLCGGVLFFLLTQATLPDGSARDHQSGVKDEHKEPILMTDLIYTFTGSRNYGAAKDTSKYKDCLTEEGDAFVPKEVARKLKELRRDHSPEAQAAYRLFSRADTLFAKEKALKVSIKTGSAALEAHTKTAIEGLSDEQALVLLEKKWIAPLTAELAKLPDSVVNSLVGKIQALQQKYATTFFDVENEIHETERQLAQMLDELDGSEYDLKGLSEFKSLLEGD